MKQLSSAGSRGAFPSALSGRAESIGATVNHVSITSRSAESHRAGPEMDHLQNRAEARPSVPLVAPLLSSYLWGSPEGTTFLKVSCLLSSQKCFSFVASDWICVVCSLVSLLRPCLFSQMSAVFHCFRSRNGTAAENPTHFHPLLMLQGGRQLLKTRVSPVKDTCRFA